MNLVDELHAIVAALRSAGVRYALCGGVAVSAHGAPRSTKDIDILALPMTFDEGTERERNVQRVSKIEGKDHMLLDVLLANASLAGALDDRLEVSLPEGPLTIVSRATLIRMKQMARRPQDLLDLERLERGDG